MASWCDTDRRRLKHYGAFVDEEEDEEQDTGGERSFSYEDAISRCGYGCFHYKVLLLCGWAVSSDAVEILGISFILPPATKELGLSDADKGWINSSVFLGMMVGGYIWGTLADLQGRRSVLMWSLSLNAIGGLCSSFAQTYWLFVLLRFISGVGVGGSMPVIFTYFCEFQPKDKRGSMISVLATFWMGGNILAAAVAWIIIPLDINASTPTFSYTSWRVYLAICTLPALSSALMFVLMPESPKFLMQKGRELDALRVFERVHHGNQKNKYKKYEVERLEVSYSSLDLSDLPLWSWLKLQVASFAKSTVTLYRAPLTSVSIVMTIIYFTLSFGYYGLFMWFPELFARIELYGGSACAPKPLPPSINETLTTVAPPDDLANTIYFESFLTALSNLPGNILTIFIIDKVGRKILLSSSMMISGVSVFFIYLLDNKTQSLIMSCVFSAISVIGWNALDVLQAELFPTNLRSTASGVLMSVGRVAAVLGNTAFGQLVDTNCAIPMIMVAVLLGGGGLAAIKLPNMTKRDLL